MQVSPGANRIVLFLAPLALAGGLAMRWTNPAPPPLAIDLKHEQWVERARAAARDTGIDASTWTPSFSLHQDEDAGRRAASGQNSAIDARLRPLATITVTLKEPDGKSFEARLNQAGDLLSWSTSGIGPSAISFTVQTAAANILKPYAGATLTSPDDSADEYKRSAVFPGAPRKYPLRVDLRDGHPVGAWIGNTGDEGEPTGNAAEKALQFCGVSLTGFFLFYSLVLFRRRRLEGEIPRERALILIAIFGLCGFLFAALNANSVSISGGFSTLISLGMAILSGLGKSILFMLGGLFVAAAYASGEGEIREGWPGKLISFDALLAGKWFTRPVGRSAAIAGAIAAWAFLLASVAWQLSPARSQVLLDDDLLSLALGRNVFVRSLADLPLRVSFLIVAGLFMPLAFIHRKKWAGWKSWTVVLMCPLVVDAGLRSFSLSGLGAVVTSLGMVAVMAASFYYGDVLAAVLGALVYSALTSAAAMSAAVPAVSGTEALLVGVVVLALGPMMAAAVRGREVDELSVRPSYARNLAERLSLKAEVNAARQAQLRLLPSAMPQRPDISVAAYCQPAGVVGGDFYDFFPAPGEQLGVFVASGGGLGLASALTIAMAKGFLWSEVKRGETPRTSIEELLHALSGRVGAAAERTGLLLMILDAAGGEARMARRGEFPAVWRMRGKDCTRVEFTGDDSEPVKTAAFPWHPGDSLIAHTEGLPALLTDQSAGGQRQWFEVTANRTLGAPAGWIEQDLTTRLAGRGGRRLRNLRRDLTTVVLRNQLA